MNAIAASSMTAGMWPYHPELLSKPVPRYTSFPTAAEFEPSVGPADLVQALADTDGDLSLYVHIPFCEQICWYCGCNTNRTNRIDRLTSYLEALHHEIALIGAALPASARVRRIAFGGGSPNAISPTDFVRLMLALTQSFTLDDPVISVEVDPRSMTPAWAEALRGVGVRAASLGVQTFAPELQAAIGRVQPLSVIEACTGLLRQAGIRSLNFDLMYGLPGQGWPELEASLAEASRLGADRIALFGYAHVPHLIPRQKRIDAATLPDQRARFEAAARGHDRLVDAGYVPVGFDHFALPGDRLAQAALEGRLRRNFQGFTDDNAPVLVGIGASAISSFPHLLAQNEKNPGRYRMMLSRDRHTVTRGIRRSADDRLRAGIIEQLLCTGRAQVGDVMDGDTAGRLAPFLDLQLIELGDGVLSLAASALPYARTIAAIFDPYRTETARKFSAAV